MKILKITFNISSDLAEAIDDYLIGVHGAAIVSEIDNSGSPSEQHAFIEKDQGTTEEFEELALQISEYGEELARIFSCDPPHFLMEIMDNQDWNESWKEHFKPFIIVPDLVIAPTWAKYRKRINEQVIVMDPGMAFGTGHHETTKLCIEFLRESEAVSSGGTILDVGTGTGILAIAAVLFGACVVVGIDNDPEAVKAARSNCRLNGLSDQIEISGRNLKDVVRTFDLVVANIVHDVLLELSEDLSKAAGEMGSLLLSGLIDGIQSDNIALCFAEKGFKLVDKRTDGQWCALLMSRSK